MGGVSNPVGGVSGLAHLGGYCIGSSTRPADTEEKNYYKLYLRSDSLLIAHYVTCVTFYQFEDVNSISTSEMSKHSENLLVSFNSLVVLLVSDIYFETN